MKLSEQVCSLELAKKLKELGVKQNGYFSWVKSIEQNHWELSEYWRIEDMKKIAEITADHFEIYNIKTFDEISAFTVAELGEILPNEFRIGTEFFKSSITNKLSSVTIGFNDKIILSDTEVTSRAKMIIFLLENGLI